MATRLAGSSDLYERSGRRPYASVNFVTAHDGFTLADLVSYNVRHNEANGEENRDGLNENLSWNCGVEGPTDDPAIRALRERQQRNFLATLLLSQGVPMICGGDEIGRTQGGNNNAFCQDNATSWHDWELDAPKRDLLAFATALIRLRKSQPVLHRRRFFQGRRIRGADVKDIKWFEPSGREMDDAAWNAHFVRCLGVRLNGTALAETDERGDPITGDTLLVLFNAHHESLRFVLPAEPGRQWIRIIDTARHLWHVRHRLRDHTYRLSGRSLAVFVLRPATEDQED